MTITTLTPTSYRTEYNTMPTDDTKIECGFEFVQGGPEEGATAIGYAVFDTSALDGETITKVEMYRHFIDGTEGSLSGIPRVLTHAVEGVECYSEGGVTFTNDQWIEFTSDALTAINKTGNSEVNFRSSAAPLFLDGYTRFSGPQLRITHETPAPITITGTFSIQLMVGS